MEAKEDTMGAKKKIRLITAFIVAGDVFARIDLESLPRGKPMYLEGDYAPFGVKFFKIGANL